MKQTLFLGVATVLSAIGSFLATRQHFHSAYSLFGGTVVMAIIAVWVTYRSDYRHKRGREELGRILVELSQYERAAYNGNDAREYEILLKQIERIKQRVAETARKYGDCSIESRFLAVNVFDVELSEAMKLHFIADGKGSFWTAFQQINGWRKFLNDLLRELHP